MLAFVRQYGTETILCVNNLSPHPQATELRLDEEFAGLRPTELLGHSVFPRIGTHPYLLTLAGHGFYWFRLEKPTTAHLSSTTDRPARTAGEGKYPSWRQ